MRPAVRSADRVSGLGPRSPQRRHRRRFRGRFPSGLAPFAFLLAAVTTACQEPAPAARRMALDQGWEFRLTETAADSAEARPADAPGWRAPDASGARGEGLSEPGGPETEEDGRRNRAGLRPGLADTLSRWHPATVPGTVHTDLLANGLIPDPFWRDNELRLQWIGREDWTYRTTFQADLRLLEAEVVELLFHGLDTFAEVRLNGRELLSADNMFRHWRVDVTRVLEEGENTLEVRFRSPLGPALEARRALPFQLPMGNDRGDPPTRAFVRKAAYHYGWDWGPRFVTMGIWRGVELVAWSGARLTDLHVATDSLSEEAAFLTAHVALTTSRPEAERRTAGGRVPAVLTLSSPDGAFPGVSREVVLEEGPVELTLSLTLQEPRLWWPNGAGEAHLYPVRAVLSTGRRVDTLHTRVGVRTVELVTEADSLGESFHFRVNGIPLFMKGANVIPLDHFTPRVTEADYRALFRDVASAHMNMLRVWGGGIYEEDLFYDLADEHGILIWQDFMFANGMVPPDSAFRANVRAEARDQVRRLRSHPSLALWCGNNEMEEGWRHWGWARAYDTPEDSARVREAYDAIFHGVLPEVVSREDPTRGYWPSSPSVGWGSPESLVRGDAHYWGVWHGREPFSVFAEKLPRFMSEYGFQAFPPMETVEAFTEPGDRHLQHPVLLVHQKHPIGNELIREYMRRDYPVPSTLEDFVYVSQLLQARGMRTAFEAHRRSRPRTMGTLYWQLNDTWPVISWSGRDYFGRWKALHYAAREAFHPVLLSPVLRGDSVEVWGVSDQMEAVEGTLRLELVDFQGTTLWQSPVSVGLSPNRSTRLWARGQADLLRDADPSQVVLVATLEGPELTPREALLYFRRPRDLALAAPTINVTAEEASESGQVLLTLESDVLAKDVYLALPPGSSEHFRDNFFDLLPGRPRRVTVTTNLTPGEVEEALRIRTLAEVPREGEEVGEEPGAER